MLNKQTIRFISNCFIHIILFQEETLLCHEDHARTKDIKNRQTGDTKSRSRCGGSPPEERNGHCQHRHLPPRHPFRYRRTCLHHQPSQGCRRPDQCTTQQSQVRCSQSQTPSIYINVRAYISIYRGGHIHDSRRIPLFRLITFLRHGFSIHINHFELHLSIGYVNGNNTIIRVDQDREVDR